MENLGIDPKLLIAQVVNFVVFFVVFKMFIVKPFNHMISEEKRKEAERERILTELTTKEERMKKEEADFLRKLAHQKDKELEETKKTAQQLKQDTLAETKQESAAMLEKARAQIEQERQTLQNQIRLKTIDLSIFMIDKALKEYLTDDTKKKLTEYIVKNLGKEVPKYEN